MINSLCTQTSEPVVCGPGPADGCNTGIFPNINQVGVFGFYR